MAGRHQGRHQSLPDEAGAAGDEQMLAAGQGACQPGGGCIHQLRRAPGRRQIAQARTHHARRRDGAQPAGQAMVGRRQRRRLPHPLPQPWQQQRQQRAIIEGEQCVGDPLAGRQAAGAVFLHEIPQGDDQLAGQQQQQRRRPQALRPGEAQRQKQQGIGQVAHPVQPQFGALAGAPGQALGAFMVPDRVKAAHGHLGEQQGPQRVSHGQSPCRESG